MAVDQDRVEAALSAWFGEGDWRSRNVRYRELMSQALAAADAPAPPADTGDEAATAMRRLEQVLDDERIAAHGLEAEVERLTRERDEALKAVALGKTVITEQCAEIDRLEAARQSCARDAQTAERERDEMRAEVEALRRSEDEWASKTEVAQSYADALIGAKNRLQARAETAEARLARAREALDERTFHSDYQVSVWSQELDGLRKCAAIVRALADTDPAGRAALAAEETQQ
jgi:chromosome segregation ATPase